jgi:hypothetical protein
VAVVNLVEGENPRWTACRVALGREFKVWEFLNWNRARWVEFATEVHGYRPRSDNNSPSNFVLFKLGMKAGQAAPRSTSWKRS